MNGTLGWINQESFGWKVLKHKFRMKKNYRGARGQGGMKEVNFFFLQSYSGHVIKKYEQFDFGFGCCLPLDPLMNEINVKHFLTLLCSIPFTTSEHTQFSIRPSYNVLDRAWQPTIHNSISFIMFMLQSRLKLNFYASLPTWTMFIVAKSSVPPPSSPAGRPRGTPSFMFSICLLVWMAPMS